MLYSVADKNDEVLFLYNRRKHEKNITIPMHYHDWYEFFMLFSGFYKISWGGYLITASTNDFLLLLFFLSDDFEQMSYACLELCIFAADIVFRRVVH